MAYILLLPVSTERDDLATALYIRARRTGSDNRLLGLTFTRSARQAVCPRGGPLFVGFLCLYRRRSVAAARLTVLMIVVGHRRACRGCPGRIFAALPARYPRWSIYCQPTMTAGMLIIALVATGATFAFAPYCAFSQSGPKSWRSDGSNWVRVAERTRHKDSTRLSAASYRLSSINPVW